MAKLQKRYVCQSCGSVSHRWAGQCGDCSEWNTLVEEAGAVVSPFQAKHNLQGGGRAIAMVALDTEVVLPERRASGIAELDRALGGGFVEGSATLIGGDPGERAVELRLDDGLLAARLALVEGLADADDRQELRGEGGESQVPDCELAVACGSGGMLSCMGTVVLGREGPS